MKVCLVQLQVAPVGQHLSDRLEHIETLLSKVVERFDIAILPETAFSNYCIPNTQAALTIAKQADVAKLWLAKVALKYNCYVAAGLVSIYEKTKLPCNSLVVLSPSGNIIHEQLKCFLYDSDKIWTKERSEGFTCLTLSEKLEKPVRVIFSVCNDINGYDFSDEEMAKFSLANAVKSSKAQILFLLTAWCSAHPSSPSDEHDAPVEVDNQIDYWIERLEPLWGTNTYFCSADLVGRELIPGTNSLIRYCGSSCSISLKNNKLINEPLDTENEGTLVCHLEL